MKTYTRINKKSSQSNDVLKSDQTEIESNKVSTKEEKKRNDIKADTSNETRTDVQQTNSSKGKEPVWLYVVGGVFALAVIVALYSWFGK